MTTAGHSSGDFRGWRRCRPPTFKSHQESRRDRRVDIPLKKTGLFPAPPQIGKCEPVPNFILAEEEVISTTLLKEFEGMAAFRNILVHDYFRLDLDQVYGILRDCIKTLAKLAKVYAALLE